MTAPVFVADGQELAAARPGALLRLDGPEGRHAVSVRRLRTGEALVLVDGRGLRATGVVASVTGSALQMRVEQVDREPQPSVRLVVVLALIKGDRLDAALSMLTEVGVDEIVLWAAQRCVVQWRAEKADRALQRAAAVVAEAGKQARRARFPDLPGVASSTEVATRLAAGSTALVLHESAVDPLPSCLPLPAAGEVVLVIGPEGGITEEELRSFAAAGARTVRMGPTVLRSATAAVGATAAVMAACGRWG